MYILNYLQLQRSFKKYAMCLQVVLGNGCVLQMVEDGCDDDAKYSAHARIRPRCSSRVTAGPIKGTVERDHGRTGCHVFAGGSGKWLCVADG